MTCVVRDACREDVVDIAKIYNFAIRNSVATFDTEAKSVENRQLWLEQHQQNGFPVLVAESDGNVVGWACLTEWSDRCAYSATSETSVYIDFELHGKGIGTQLLAELVQRAKDNGTHTLLARIADHNLASIRLHERFGFEVVGVMKEVGRKFDRYLDVRLMQLVLSGDK